MIRSMWHRGCVLALTGRLRAFSEVLVALNALEARAILQKNAVDVMLCDIEMPMENGLSLIRWVREQKMPVRCILLTAHPDFQYAREAIPLDVTDYIVQPAPYSEVLRVVRKAVQECGERVARRLLRPAMRTAKAPGIDGEHGFAVLVGQPPAGPLPGCAGCRPSACL